MPTGPSPHPFPTSHAPAPSAHVLASTPAHAHRSFSLPISNLPLAPTPSANVRASTLPFPTFSLHPHRPHMSAHPRALMPTGPSPRLFPIFALHPNCRHTSAHPRSLMPVPLPTHNLSLAPAPSAKNVRASTLAHSHRSFSRPFSNRSLAPNRPHTSAHVQLSAHLPASTLAHAHRPFSPLISNVPSTHTLRTHPRIHARAHRSFLLTHFQPFPCTHTIRTRLRIHAPSCPPVLLPTPSAHVRPSTLAHAHRSFSLPISNFSVAPALSVPTGPSLHPPISNFSFHPHRLHTSAHPRAHAYRSFLHTFPTYFPCTHTVRTRQRIHARSCPPALLPTHFQPFPCTHIVRTRLRTHARWCPPVLLPTHLTFPLHPHRPHTSAHPFLLTISNLFPCTHSVCTRPLSTLAHAHRSFFPPISNLSLAPKPSAHVCISTLAHAHHSFSPPISNLSNFQFFPCTSAFHTLAHAHWPLSPPFSIFSVAPTLSAHVRSSQVALCAVSRLNENPSIEDAFGKTVGLLEGKRCLKWGPLVLEVKRCLKWVVFWRVKWGLCPYAPTISLLAQAQVAIPWTSDFQDDMFVSYSSSHNTSKKFRANGRMPWIPIWTRPTSSSRHYPEQQLTDLPPIDFPLTNASTSQTPSHLPLISLSHHLHGYVWITCQLTIHTSWTPTTRFTWTFQSLPSVAQLQPDWHQHLWQGQIQSTRLRELKRLQ